MKFFLFFRNIFRLLSVISALGVAISAALKLLTIHLSDTIFASPIIWIVFFIASFGTARLLNYFYHNLQT